MTPAETIRLSAEMMAVIADVLEALTTIANQKTVAEIEDEDVDYEYAYDAIVKLAREVIAKTEAR